MKPLFFLFTILIFASCAPRGGYITQSQLQDTTFVAGTFDTLAAYRKAPGQEHTVNVAGYYRKDSTFVEAHARSARRTKAEMVTQ